MTHKGLFSFWPPGGSKPLGLCVQQAVPGDWGGGRMGSEFVLAALGDISGPGLWSDRDATRRAPPAAPRSPHLPPTALCQGEAQCVCWEGLHSDRSSGPGKGEH